MIKHFRIKNNFLLSGLFFLVTLFSVGSSLVSCSDSEKIVTQTEEKIVYVDGNWMVVASKEVTVMTGESVTLNVSVGGEEELKPEYTCTSKDANIATVAVSDFYRMSYKYKTASCYNSGDRKAKCYTNTGNWQ